MSTQLPIDTAWWRAFATSVLEETGQSTAKAETLIDSAQERFKACAERWSSDRDRDIAETLADLGERLERIETILSEQSPRP
jgi:hypothetical protein